MHKYSHSGAQKSQRCFWKFISCMTFGAHKLVRSEPFLDYSYEFLYLLSALYSDMCKQYLYMCTSWFQSLNNWVGFKKSLSYLYEVVRTKLFANFWIFRNFRPPLCENCGAPGGGKANCVVHPKQRSLRTQTIHPSNTQRSWLEAWQKTNTTSSRPLEQNWCESFFDPTHSFSYRAHWQIWHNWLTVGFSAITP